MNQEEIDELLLEALRRLYEEEEHLFRADAAERTVCARLAMILQGSFDHHSVDVEFNRHGFDPKEIEWPDTDGTPTVNKVYPDIIVHQRGHDEENLLVIEVKKTSNPAPDEGDLQKLSRIKHALNYRYAVFLRLPFRNDAEIDKVQVNWIA
ncbi:MAG: hypothetical protein J0I79_19705 [Mesorhizobium sp.]|uniref:hypothetical protein n=1 Tax=Mesorhizobium sp. TaxID=1871066 RepID=UPI001AC0B056|nr:hypothetical protein [Mesorhizobium sp.]MBN9220177.1 hypothetical protein [Mesorhizobium sp.]